jgi:hypothetical protein
MAGKGIEAAANYDMRLPGVCAIWGSVTRASAHLLLVMPERAKSARRQKIS